MIKTGFLLLLFISTQAFIARAQHIELLQQGKRSSIRGLSVVDDSVAWISGSGGTIATTFNGGKTWTWQQIKGYEKADFRDIEAFSDKKAIIMSSGTPSLILKTTDGGVTWKEQYHNVDSTYFLDAMDFDNPKNGVVLGDPIKNKFLLLETDDAGESWHPFKNLPDAIVGEAAFAASGTCLRLNKGQVHIVTGGTTARHLEFEPSSKKWFAYNLPIAQGQSSKGAFSIATKYNWVVVGGNYAKNRTTDSVSCTFDNSIKAKYQLSQKGPSGFQSCIEAISKNNYISTGTSGSNFSVDGGINWIKIDNISYNVCRKAKNGNLILLAGDNGKIGVFKPL
jgi:photosystem II stability/assembly factor-like uncharacterized protein